MVELNGPTSSELMLKPAVILGVCWCSGRVEYAECGGSCARMCEVGTSCRAFSTLDSPSVVCSMTDVRLRAGSLKSGDAVRFSGELKLIVERLERLLHQTRAVEMRYATGEAGVRMRFQ